MNVHSFNFPHDGFLVMGNESNGISPKIENLIKYKITIPRYGPTESLNVAMATGIITDNWVRQISK
jgi:TrmH family RNA methyltransferase